MDPVVFAHIGHVAEPLLFLPAFGAVIWAMVATRRRPQQPERDIHG